MSVRAITHCIWHSLLPNYTVCFCPKAIEARNASCSVSKTDERSRTNRKGRLQPWNQNAQFSSFIGHLIISQRFLSPIFICIAIQTMPCTNLWDYRANCMVILRHRKEIHLPFTFVKQFKIFINHLPTFQGGFGCSDKRPSFIWCFLFLQDSVKVDQWKEPNNKS